jgi:hypothetical protein
MGVKKSLAKAQAGRPASSSGPETRPASAAASRPGTAKLKPVQDRLELQRAQVRRDAEASYQEARRNGIGGTAIRFWEEAARKAKADTDSGCIAKPLGQLKQAGAGVMKFQAQMSNVAELEGSAAKLGYLSGSGVATRGDMARASAVTALDAGLAATNFIGVGGIVKGSARRAAAQQLIRQREARFGAAVAKDAVKGMLKAKPAAATAVADDLKRIVGTLPDQGKLGAKKPRPSSASSSRLRLVTAWSSSSGKACCLRSTPARPRCPSRPWAAKPTGTNMSTWSRHCRTAPRPWHPRRSASASRSPS